MTAQFDVLGFEYDDSEPAFELLKGGIYYYHFETKKLLEKTSFDAWMTAQNKTFGANELGTPSAAYLMNHLSIASRAGAATPAPPGGGPPSAAGTPITATVTKKPAATADDTGQITVAGGPADKAYLITLTTKDSTAAGDNVVNINVAKGDTAAQTATKIAAALSTPLAGTSAGAVVTVKPSKGGQLDKLEVAVAAQP